MEAINVNVLNEIFSYLKPKDLKSVVFVNKKWNNMANNVIKKISFFNSSNVNMNLPKTLTEFNKLISKDNIKFLKKTINEYFSCDLGSYSKNNSCFEVGIIQEINSIILENVKISSNDQKILHRIGNRYSKGQGVEENFKKAFDCYQKAADLGDLDSLCKLGPMYENGQGVEKNFKKAFDCYQKAANLGVVDSLCKLGPMYENGQGVEKNFKKAFHCYQIAANFGDLNSLYHLGVMYLNGQGVEKDLKKASDCFQRAADLGHQPAYNALGIL